MYTTYLLILSSFDRHRLLPCFHYCGITLLWTRCTNISSRPCFHFFGLHTQKWSCWIIYNSFFLFFEELPCCFPQWLYHFIFPPTLGVILMSEMVTHCAFDLHFPQWLVMLSIFSCAYWPFVRLLWRIIYSSLLPIFESSCLSFCCWVVGVLYIFWILIPYQIYDLQYFLPSCGLPFYFGYCLLTYNFFKIFREVQVVYFFLFIPLPRMS